MTVCWSRSIPLGGHIAAELTAGLVLLFATWKLFGARHSPAQLFQAEKSWVLVGAGIALVTWFIYQPEPN